MSRSRVSLKRALFVSGFAAVAMFSTTAMAAASSSPAAGNTTPTTKTTTQKTTAAAATKSTTPESSEAVATTTPTTGRTTGVITATGTASTESDGTMPAVTSSTSKLSLPTLSTATTDTAVPTYPAPSVPPTADAPFMRHSNLADGTVFIIVGAILGAFGAAVLIWRAAIAYLLHRSIARAALAQHLANDKAPFASASTMPLYKYSDHDSSQNLGGGGLGGLGGAGGVGGVGGAGTGRGVRRTNRGPTPSATPSQTNLFFSPTAPGAAGGNNNRDSRFLPSGFYAAGAGVPAGAPHGQAISMTNLRPESFVNTRTSSGHSPSDSPNFGPLRNSVANYNMGGSAVSLNRPPSGRAPSAFLDELLDEQPHLFPTGSGPSHDQSYSPPRQGPARF